MGFKPIINNWPIQSYLITAFLFQVLQEVESSQGTNSVYWMVDFQQILGQVWKALFRSACEFVVSVCLKLPDKVTLRKDMKDWLFDVSFHTKLTFKWALPFWQFYMICIYIEDITWWREDMNFIFNWQNNIVWMNAASE